MQKPVTVQYDIHELLKQRWSPRAYSSRSIEPAKLWSLFEAARWSPSSANEQPWSFIVAFKGDATHDKMVSALAGRNADWARNAPVLILTIAQQNYKTAGRPYRHALYDVGQAVAHLSVQATAEGLHIHQMGGFDADKARELFVVPEGYEVVVVLAVGYLGNIADLPDDMRERENAPRTRKALSEFVFADQFGAPLSAETVQNEVVEENITGQTNAAR